MISLAILAAALVAGGESKVELVVPENAPQCVRGAAADLQEFVKKLTGADLMQCDGISCRRPTVRWRLAAPGEKLNGIEGDGFRIIVDRDGLVISANEPYGIVYSTYWMLNRFGKMYWFDPESGCDYVKTDRLEIPDGEYLENPIFKRVGMGEGFKPRGKERLVAEWNLRNGFAPRHVDKWMTDRYGFIPQTEFCGHALGDLVCAAPVDTDELKVEIARIKAAGEQDKFLNVPHNSNESMIRQLAYFNLNVKKHPNRFPLIDGRRCPTGVTMRGPYKGKVGNPCIADPECREYLLKAIRKVHEDAVAKNDGRSVKFLVGFMCDDNSQWCECEKCMRLLKNKGADSGDDRASDHWWDFLNWMTPRLLEDPDTEVNSSLYLTYRQMPKKVKPIVYDKTRQSVLVCPHGRCYLHPLTDEKCKLNKKYREMFLEWTRLGMPVWTFEYHFQLPGKGNYAFFEKSWVEDLKWYRENNIMHQSGGCWGLWWGYPGHPGLSKIPMYEHAGRARWQFVYLTGHFSWNTGDDFGTVRKDVLTRYYRAAKEMLEYHALLEDAIFRANICMCYGSSPMPFVVAATETGLLDKAKVLLKTADEKAGDDEELRKRIARDRKYLYLDWEVAAQSALSAASRRLSRAQDAVELDGVLDERTWKVATISDDYRWQKNWNVDAAQTDPMVPHTLHKAAYDDENLYVAVVCSKANGKVKDVPAKKSLWDAMAGSCLEFCLQAPCLNGDYYHFALSHDGDTYSAITQSPTTRDLDRKLDFKYAIKDEPDRWIVEMAIPLRTVGLPKEGETWKFCVMRTAVGPEGDMRTGTSTGFPIHWQDRWEGISFGQAGNLVENASFEHGTKEPRGVNRNTAETWKFLQEEAPDKWGYQENSGTLDWREGDTAEGKRYIRVTCPGSDGNVGPSFIVAYVKKLYPPSTAKLKVAFSARGTGEIQVYSFGGKYEPLKVKLDSEDWKRYEGELDLKGEHPNWFTIRFFSKTPIDLDDVVIIP